MKTNELNSGYDNLQLQYGARERGTNYTNCTFSTKGMGAFKPIKDSKPYIGMKEKLELEEEKIEVICDVDKVKEVMLALREGVKKDVLLLPKTFLCDIVVLAKHIKQSCFQIILTNRRIKERMV